MINDNVLKCFHQVYPHFMEQLDIAYFYCCLETTEEGGEYEHRNREKFKKSELNAAVITSQKDRSEVNHSQLAYKYPLRIH